MGAHNTMQENVAQRTDAQPHMQLRNVFKELDGERMGLSTQSLAKELAGIGMRLSTQSLHARESLVLERMDS